jgi:hypothetical protein
MGNFFYVRSPLWKDSALLILIPLFEVNQSAYGATGFTYFYTQKKVLSLYG